MGVATLSYLHYTNPGRFLGPLDLMLFLGFLFLAPALGLKKSGMDGIERRKTMAAFWQRKMRIP